MEAARERKVRGTESTRLRLDFGWSCAISERWVVGEGYLAQGERLGLTCASTNLC